MLIYYVDSIHDIIGHNIRHHIIPPLLVVYDIVCFYYAFHIVCPSIQTPNIGIWRYWHHESSIVKLRYCALISGTILIFYIKEYIPISNTVIFYIEAPRNGWCRVYVNHLIEESAISNVFSSISHCFNIEDSSISAFKIYNYIGWWEPNGWGWTPWFCWSRAFTIPYTLIVPDIVYDIILRHYAWALSIPACTRAAVVTFLRPTRRQNWSGRGAWTTSCNSTTSSENEFCRGGEWRPANLNLLKISLLETK